MAQNIILSIKYVLVCRHMVQSVLMTGADLCSSTKPWDMQLMTLNDIYNEFYTQGDIEISEGRAPVPIMNRVCQDDQALHQVTVNVVTTCY